MDTIQNVTLAIPKDILRKAKILAVQKNISLSGLLTQTLADLVAHQEAYEQGAQRNLSIQVLQELFVNVTQKLSAPLDHHTARQLVADLAQWRLQIPEVDDLLQAI